jgi:hypothetical protein
MKLTCDEATTICDKNQYNEATLWEKIKLSVHIFLCNKCGLYSKQNSIMTECYETHKEFEKSKLNGLCEEEKKHMEEKVEAKM